MTIAVPRPLRSAPLCGVRLHAGAAHACRFLVTLPEAHRPPELQHRIELRQFDARPAGRRRRLGAAPARGCRMSRPPAS